MFRFPISIRLSMLTVMLLCCSAIATAEPLWKRFTPGQHIEADPNSDYPLSENHGPWMIMASTFRGDGAQTQARQLIHELRSKYNLAAYSYSKTFDFTAKFQGRGINHKSNPRMEHHRKEKVTELAVLVGDFPTINDPKAQAILEKIKYLKTDTLSTPNHEKNHQTFATLRYYQKEVKKKLSGNKDRVKGEMGQAFMTRNPLIPKEYFVPKGLDKLVLKMNNGVQYGLLDCPGKYSVKVATFKGKTVMSQSKVEQYQKGEKFESRLEKAALNAHRLTLALREKGWDAYEFHDRYASIVTVGGFNSYGSPRADGKIEINPQINAIMKAFSAKPVDANSMNLAPALSSLSKTNLQQAYQPKSLLNIPFDIQPQIVSIPKRSISSNYAQ